MEIKLLAKLPTKRLEESLKRHVQIMNQAGNFQWDSTYPKAVNYQQDIDKQQLYGLYDDEKLLGLFALTTKLEEHYYEEKHNFKFFQKNDKILYIHRIIKLSTEPTKGFGKTMLSLIIDMFIDKFDAIQIDTNAKNIPMQKAIEQAGFTQKGTFIRKEKSSPNWKSYEITKQEVINKNY